jgi:hypothetical protein
METRLINGNEVFTECTLTETGERFFRTRDGIFDERGNLVSERERPDVWQLLTPNAIVVDDLRGVALSRFAALERRAHLIMMHRQKVETSFPRRSSS